MTSRSGVVLRVDGPLAWVASEGSPWRCALKGTFKDLVAETANPVAVGDRVLFRSAGDGEGLIETVEPRGRCLSRAHPHAAGEQVVVANVDRILVVVSWSLPRMNSHLVDRFLVAGGNAGIQVAICVNKADLAPPGAMEEATAVYREIGYRVLVTSAVDGRGVEDLVAALAGRTTAMAGPSGAGKSSLLNRVEPGLGLMVREASAATGKGRHTTSAVTLFPLAAGGFVADTPGVREFGLWRVRVEDLSSLFVEFLPRSGGCRFYNCLHDGEPGCGVLEAVEEGRISSARYGSYLAILDDLRREAPAQPSGRRRQPALRTRPIQPGRRQGYKRGRAGAEGED